MKAEDKLVIEGVVSGKPHPTTFWIKDGKEIFDDEKINILKSSDKASLSILKSQRSDSGVYTLKVENNNGKIEAVTKVEVLGEMN